MNKYGAIYGGKEYEVMADTLYQAQEKAREYFQGQFPRRKVKGYEVTIALLELDGKEYIHSTAF